MNRLSSGITRAALRLGLIGLIILGGWASEKNSYSVTGAQTSGVTMYVSGRDKWVPSGTSRILRIIGTENLISPGATPTVTFSPAPVAVNYVVVASLDDLTVSITVPAGTAPGPQQLSVTDGTITHTLAEAIRIVDGTIANPSPALMGLGESTILTFPAHPLLQGQTFFSLDLGPDVAVGPLSLQDNGTLRAPVSVLTSAIPGTRSVHLTAGPYSILAERGFAIDFGPPVNNYTLNVPGGNLSQFKVQVPAGYMAAVFAAPGSSKRIFFPGGLYVDEHNHLFVLNHGLVSSLVDVPFFVSVWDLNPANFGAFLGIISHLEIDPTGTDNGVLEKGRMLPNRPGTLYLSTEDDAIQGFPGGRRIYAVDTNTNTSSVFLDNPDWNLDPIETDVRGNLIIGNRVDSIGQLDVTLLDSQANIIKVCVPNNYFGDTLSLDPLSGEYLYENLKGASMLDFSACSSRPWTGSPEFDEGSFAAAAGDFGNQFFFAPEVEPPIETLVPVSFDDPDQSFPTRAVAITSSFPNPDDVVFDREGKYMLVTDDTSFAVVAISRIPGYQPPSPELSLSSASLEFSDQLVGTTSPPQSVSLTNIGTAPLTIADISSTGDFAASSDCGSGVDPGSACSILVTFASSEIGVRSGTLTITDNAPGAPQTLRLTGTGTVPPPVLSLSASSLTFGSQVVGTTSAAQSVKLTNTGTSNLTITALSISGDFAEASSCGTLPATLAPSATCALNVTFTPTAGGTRTGTVTITDNAIGGEQLIALTGAGTAPGVSLTPSNLTFGGQMVGTTSTAQVLTLSNTGNADLTISSIALTGANSADFGVMSAGTTCSASSPVAAGASCTISLTFTPTDIKARNGTLTIADNNSAVGGSTQTVALTGTGLAPVASLAPSIVPFSGQAVGTTSTAQGLTLSNTGNANLAISSIAITGANIADFGVMSAGTTCSASSPVAAGASCTINVTFAPTASGSRAGTLTIADNAQGSPHTVALSGTGEDFTVLSSPASASVAAGGSTTYQLTVAPAGGFNQAVNLGCTGAPAHSVCAINPNSLTPSGSGASTATVTVSTAASSEVAPRGPQTPSGLRPWEIRHGPLLVWLAVLAMLGLAGAKASRRYRGQSAEFAPLMPVRGFALGLMLLMALAWAACSTAGPVPARLQGTPAGTYTITLTATDPQANNLSHSATVTLTVTQ